MRRLIPLAAALCLGAVSSASAGENSPFAKSRVVSGGDAWSQIDALRHEGSVQTSGLSGTISYVERLRDGLTLSRYDLQVVSGAEGYDGTTSWRQDPGGEVVHLDSADDRNQAITSAWLARRGYWRDDGASYGAASRRQDGDQRFTVMTATPDGGVPVELWFDEASGLLARYVIQRGQDTVVTRLSDFRRVDGVLLPFHTEVDDGRPANLVVVDYTTVAAIPAPETAAFAAPKPAAPGAQIAGGITEVPFDLVGNHLYVDAKVNGQPVRMLVDTGGLNMLTPAAAARLGLSTKGSIAARGTGEGSAEVSLTRGDSVEVGGARLDNPAFYVFDLGKIASINGVEFDGLVGFELFHRFIVRIDYAGRKLTLIEPARFTAPADAVALPFEFDERTPMVEAEIDGLHGRFTIDTGSRNTLALHSPLVNEHGLIERYGARFETAVGWGVGGPSPGRPARFGRFNLGGIAMDGVLGNLSVAKSGAMADPRIAGNIGGGLLKQFTVTFDYPNRRMYLQPNANFGEREHYDRLGSWLMHDGGNRLRLGTIIAGSAAERAGLHVDDRLLAVDGQPVATRSLDAWRQLFRETAPGTAMALALQRGERRFEARVTLAELVP